MLSRSLLFLISFLSASYASSPDLQDDWDPLKYVNPLIGSVKYGNVFAGATIPYGMAKPVADTDDVSNQGGFVFNSTANVTGFSSMHDSGTGGSPSLGNFALFPHDHCPHDDLNSCDFPKKSRKIKFDNESVVAEPGYFKIRLANNVTVDMTSTHHTSLFRFNFTPKGSPLILLDLTDLSDSRQDNGTISVDANGRMKGGAKFRPSFAEGKYEAFFCADFRGGKIRDSGIFVNSRASSDVKNLTISRSINGYPLPGGAFIRYGNVTAAQVTVRVGISFISVDRACEHAEKEIPNFNFEAVRNAAKEQWRQKLNPIRIDAQGVNSSLVTIFYSGIYRTMINPQDYTGENPVWSSAEPYFDSFYCLWDSFRSQIPFLMLFDPVQTARMVRSLIDTYRVDGWLPDCRMTFSRGYTQGGSNADIVLADALHKNLPGINWDLGYKAVVNDAENQPFDWCCRGRGGLDSWKSLGYIPVEDFDYKGFGTMTRTVSRTLEYSYNDYVIALMASKLGHSQDASKYLGRSQNWRNLYNATIQSANYTGFFQPKHLNQTWGYQDPLYCSKIDPEEKTSVCSLQNNAGETFESSIWEYGFYVPHDQAALMKLYGGQDAFIKRLDYLHEASHGPNKTDEVGVGDIGNEPAFLTIHQYHYAGRPGLSSQRAHFYIPSRFSDQPDGLPGNDDSGAMGSLTAFNMMGFFPNPGQDVYFINSPFFREIKFKSPLGNNTAIIRVTNFDPTYKAIYIQNATLNGIPYTMNWISHEFFVKGGELVLTVGATESKWGTRVEDVPPSLSEYPPLGLNPNAGTKYVKGIPTTRGRYISTPKSIMQYFRLPENPREVRRSVVEAESAVHNYWAAKFYT